MAEVGDVVGGRFRVERILGRGGMGEVVAARHLELGHAVALKFLQKELVGNKDARARFIREAQAAVRLRSEHVARVLDLASRRDGSMYIVMELLDGADLASVVHSTGALPVGVAVDYLLQVCEALAEAHARKIVHRDLKPENLFLCRRADGAPIVKVIDFGISKVERPVADDAGSDPTGSAGLTTEGRMMGSIAYMSPEQIRSARDVDARTDIWALGVILFELLTGKIPFDGETIPEVLLSILDREPPRVRALRAEVPAALEAVVDRCLQKDPGARFESVKELVRELGRVVKDGQIAPAEGWWPSGPLLPPNSDADVASASTLDAESPLAQPASDVRLPIAASGTRKKKRRRGAKATRSRDRGASMEATVAPVPPAARSIPWPFVLAVSLIAALALGAWWGRHQPVAGAATSGTAEGAARGAQ